VVVVEVEERVARDRAEDWPSTVTFWIA